MTRSLFVIILLGSCLLCFSVVLGPGNVTPKQPVSVVVRPGWTLQEIAQGVGMSLENLVRLNGIQNAQEIYPGQVLKTYPYTDKREAVVSWYESGKRRADGQPFDPDDPEVVAHKWLPFGTQVRLTRVDNGQSVVVVVRDRGPYILGRDFDLSRGAAKQLGIIKKGVVH